jgi:phenylpropionate dioxygenase-like ring-hydroxylating dioxygenase large terminal subunit
MSGTPVCADPVILNQWHVIAPAEEAASQKSAVLLGQEILLRVDGTGRPHVRSTATGARELPAQIRYGYVWTSLGEPENDLFDIPQYSEPDRNNLHAVTVGIRVSAPRAVENFLDMGHFPFVHTGILGAEPHTEVREYKVEIDEARDEVVATECVMYQPLAAAASKAPAIIGYTYRVPHPYCSVLYKTSGEDPSRLDVVAIFVQPEGEEVIRAHFLLSLIDSHNSRTALRAFQQTILAQDKPILENQYPKRLPLDPRAETPIRADKTSIAYRRWLAGKRITYGVIPAAN